MGIERSEVRYTDLGCVELHCISLSPRPGTHSSSIPYSYTDGFRSVLFFCILLYCFVLFDLYF